MAIDKVQYTAAVEAIKAQYTIKKDQKLSTTDQSINPSREAFGKLKTAEEKADFAAKNCPAFKTEMDTIAKHSKDIREYKITKAWGPLSFLIGRIDAFFSKYFGDIGKANAEHKKFQNYVKELNAAIKAAQKAAAKPAEGKPAADTKPAEGKPAADAKPAEGKPAADTKPAEGKPAADAKPAEGKPAADTKPAEGKPAEGKPAADTKPAEGKPATKPAEGKPAAKPAEGKPAADAKPAEGKPAEGKPAEGKPAAKPAEGKPAANARPAEGKPAAEGDKKPAADSDKKPAAEGDKKPAAEADKAEPKADAPKTEKTADADKTQTPAKAVVPNGFSVNPNELPRAGNTQGIAAKFSKGWNAARKSLLRTKNTPV